MLVSFFKMDVNQSVLERMNVFGGSFILLRPVRDVVVDKVVVSVDYYELSTAKVVL